MTSSRPAPDPFDDADRQWLSDLTDGRLGNEAMSRGCAQWSADADCRRTWHAYHLIGDVLRSDDLASPPAGDAAFLAAVRQRMSAEPVLLAPARSRRLLRVWMRPMAAAAGFVAVAGVVVVLQQASPEASPGLQIAAQRGAIVPVPVMAGAPSTADAAPRGQMLRDARVDEYLRAHREWLAGSPAALPGGAMRTVELDATVR